MATCPDGHASTATDWCSECGLPMGGQPSPAPAPQAGASIGGMAAPAAGECPNCGTARVEGEAFCEVCGLDFATGRLPEAPTAAPVAPEPGSPEPGEQAPAEEASGAGPGTASGWHVTVDADRDWFDRVEAEAGRSVEFPDAARPRDVALTGDVVTIGRQDPERGWFPDVDTGLPVLDPSTSRRHAELRRAGDGWVLVDVGSTNGTTVDGEKVASGEEVALGDGSVVHLGAFTRLTLHGPDQ